MTLVAGYARLAWLGWLALFQAMLAAGMPLGHMAWGGSERRLSHARAGPDGPTVCPAPQP